MKIKKQSYVELIKALKTIKIKGYKYLKNGLADFNGRTIDLTATAPNHLAIAYTTLRQLQVMDMY